MNTAFRPTQARACGDPGKRTESGEFAAESMPEPGADVEQQFSITASVLLGRIPVSLI
jgi:hypothetical protein